MAGEMTLTNFQDDLKEALGRPSENVTRMTRWVNAAIREVGYAIKFHCFEAVGQVSTVSGTAAYDLPADFRVMNGEPRISTPQDRFSGILVPETRTNYLRSVRYPQTSANGRPDTYHLYGEQIWLRRTPDSTVMTVDFDYWKKLTPLSGANDKSPLSDDWDDIIFRGALYRGHISHGEHDRAINIFNFFIGAVRSRISEEDLEEFPEGGISYIQSAFDASVR